MMASSEEATMAASRATCDSARRRCATAAATTRVVTLTVTMKAWSSNRVSFGDGRTNGPKPRTAPSTAMADSSALALAASRGVNRSPIQRSGGRARNATG
jgi:hypothetical protein